MAHNGIGPVNTVLNTIVHHFHKPGGQSFPAHFDALDVSLFESPDGSCEGSWAVCFTTGAWYGINGLLAAGGTAADTDNYRRYFPLPAPGEFLQATAHEDWPRLPKPSESSVLSGQRRIS